MEIQTMVIDEVVRGDIFSGERKLAYWTGTAFSGVPVSIVVFRPIKRAKFHPFLFNYVL